MKLFLPLALVATCLSGCALPNVSLPDTVPSAPVVVADKTLLDEQTGILATNGYIAASVLGTRLVKLGVIDKDKFKALDNQGYDLVQKIREAYLAGNATSYSALINQLKSVVNDMGILGRQG